MPMCYESQHLCLTLASRDALWRPAGYRPLYLHAVKTSLLNLVNSSVCEWVVCGIMAHCSPTRARGDAHKVLGFEISEPFNCWQQDSASSFLLCAGFCFWSRFAAAVFSLQPTRCQVAKRRASWSLMECRSKFMRHAPDWMSSLSMFLLSLLRRVIWLPALHKIYRQLCVSLRNMVDCGCLPQASKALKVYICSQCDGEGPEGPAGC